MSAKYKVYEYIYIYIYISVSLERYSILFKIRFNGKRFIHL